MKDIRVAAVQFQHEPSRRPELYEPLCIPTGKERDTYSVRFDG